VIFSYGKGTPITPVEQTKTSSLRHPAVFATASATAFAASTPARPVAQFALPELTTSARIRPWLARRLRRDNCTGAACTRLVVNTAAQLQRLSISTTARSGPLALIPQLPAMNRKPSGQAARLAVAETSLATVICFKGQQQHDHDRDPTYRRENNLK
jgi:hypothetical protein